MSDLFDDAPDTVSGRLAAFTAGLTADRIPTAVLEAQKRALLDAYGCGMAAVAMGQCRPVLEWVTRNGHDGDTLVAADGASATDTALATGTLIHALDFDDTHPEAMAHVTAVVGTAAVVAGQALGRTGEEVLVAAVAGSEAVARLGATASGEWHKRGLHPTNACGVFGATLAAGKLMGLDAATLTRALGLAGSTSSGLFEYLSDGSQTKPFHAGWAAHAGILAAELASFGLAGPATVVEGRFGLFAGLLGQDHGDAARAQVADLGQRWETARIAVKPYPTCHLTHAAIEAAAQMQADGVRAADIVGIHAVVPIAAPGIVTEPRDRKVSPQTPYDAKFSLHYCIAAQFVDGAVTLDTFRPERLGDLEVLRLAALVDCTVEDRGAAVPFFTRLEVRLADGGERVVDIDHPRGTPERPMSTEGVTEKFRSNAGLALADPQAFADVVLSLEQQPDVLAVALPTAVAVGA